jgi:soluble lytic murein transglycosylase-like protein
MAGIVAAIVSGGIASAEDAKPTAANPAHEEPAPTIQALVEKHAHDNGIPVELAKAVIRIESRGNPRARNHGALGLMQIRAGTARRHGFDGSATALLSAETNLHYGMIVLAEAYKAAGGDVCRTLAYYQSGHKVRRFNAAQRSYCVKARSLMARA